MRAVTVLRRDDGSVGLTCTGMKTTDASSIIELLHEGISMTLQMPWPEAPVHTNGGQ